MMAACLHQVRFMLKLLPLICTAQTLLAKLEEPQINLHRVRLKINDNIISFVINKIQIAADLQPPFSFAFNL
jgi:hypothetical protein